MANVINKATNKFTKGLVLDFSPENTGNEVLTHALNATLLTFNGNELSLQNDMGNARVETAFLPEGYIPVGTCEYGGIIYIVSYNPLEDKSQIGCFPSPERNISSDELGIYVNPIENSYFQEMVGGSPTGKINHFSQKVLLRNDKLNPGDKFIITANPSIYNHKLSDLYEKDENGEFKLKENPILSLNVVSIEDSGKIIYLNTTIRNYETDKNKYYILGDGNIDNWDQADINLDEYRSILSSGYNVFKSKTSGKLAILAELVTIDEYSVTHRVEENQAGGYNIIIHTDVSPKFETTYTNMPNVEIEGVVPNIPGQDQSKSNQSNKTNYNYIPKLKYYYLEESDYRANNGGKSVVLYDENGNVNQEFLKLNLKDLYNSNNKQLLETLDYSFSEYNTKNIPKPNTYSGRGTKFQFLSHPGNNNMLYRYVVTKKQIYNNLSYYINNNCSFYTISNSEIDNIQDFLTNIKDDNTKIKIAFPKDIIISDDIFQPDILNNNIKNSSTYTGGDSFSVQNYDFIPSNDPNNDNYLSYNDVLLACVEVPSKVKTNNLEFPTIYTYSLVPCMEYGRLDNLKVTNSIDFSKIRNFGASNFNIWKYRIDGNQLRLNIGAEIYDYFSEEKVKGLILEFYDHRGFAGSIEISDKKSYSGTFNKIITLNSFNSISKKKIIKDEYKDNNFVHNVNIIKEGQYYKYNGEIVTYDSDKGWTYNSNLSPRSSDEEVSPSLPDQPENQSDIENDCGVLYSNLIYGVKAYFKIEIEKENIVKYEKKKDLILYTFPFYNDNYYTEDTFEGLEDPKLDLVLTYMLKDNVDDFSLEPYNDNTITNGYNSDDKDKINEYISDTPTESFEAIKYYECKGTTDLYLEVGLKKDYEKINLSCDPSINEIFSCDLKLIGEEQGKTFGVSSDIYNNPNDILNYNEELNVDELNNITFSDGTGDINLPNIRQYNFINVPDNQNPLTIEYNFVIGYKFNIYDIMLTEVPATVVCALCHKKPNGEYNYSDFGISEIDGEYYNNNIIYTKGNYNKFVIGIASQKDLNKSGYQSLTYGIEYNNPHSTSSLKKIASQLGKLVFCAPHYNYANGKNYAGSQLESYGVTLRYDGDPQINPGWKFISGNTQITWCLGDIDQGNYATLNMCAITQNFGERYSQLYPMLYSTNSTKQITDPSPDQGDSVTYQTNPYLGIPLGELKDFNKYLINSMKDIYVYNPDYDNIYINKGSVNLQKHIPQFISNIISKNSSISYNENENFNNYIKIYDVKLSDYLYDLSELSNTPTIKNDIKFQPNLIYCGEEEPYLITTLTYNIPVPNALKNELEFNYNNTTIIKNSEGNIFYINEPIENKKGFYFYDKDENSLIQLDVSNYKIYDNDGKIILTDYNYFSNTIKYISKETQQNTYSTIDKLEYRIRPVYRSTTFLGTTITINDLVYSPYTEHKLFIKQNNIIESSKKLYYNVSKNNPGDGEVPSYYLTNSNNIILYTGPCFKNTFDNTSHYKDFV